MPKIQIDELEYNSEDLTEHGKAILKSLQFVHLRLTEIERELAVYRTAQQTFKKAFLHEAETAGIQPEKINKPESQDSK